MIKTKEDYRRYLIEYKTRYHKDSPANDNDYVSWWEAALEQDLTEFLHKRITYFYFRPYRKDGPLLTLDKTDRIPEKYLRKFEAYPIWGLDMGLEVVVTSEEDSVGGVIVRIEVAQK